MRRSEAERVLGEWGVRETGSVEWHREGQRLDRDGLAGRPLRRRLRNFTSSVEAYAIAVAGVPRHVERLRTIEDEEDRHLARLAEVHAELAADCDGELEIFSRLWRAAAGSWDFGAVNALIEIHNRWYPAESRLPMDPRTGDFVPVAGRPYRRRPLDAAWILERFP